MPVGYGAVRAIIDGAPVYPLRGNERMIEEVLPGLYRMEIRLPKSPLKATNSYLIKGADRCLVVDTGFNREECRRDMIDSLRQLGVDRAQVDLFITHLHADHLGLAGDLAGPGSRVYFNRRELYLAYPEEGYWQQRKEDFKSHGFSEEEISRAMDRHPGRVFGLQRPLDFTVVEDGDVLAIGPYLFRCVQTPGHTPGHTCLYEPEQKVLLGGDHILSDITPNITNWPETVDSLGQYLESLDRVYRLEVALLLPGHRGVVTDHRKRIEELKAHHKARLQEVSSALEDGDKSAFDVAPWVTWDIEFPSWRSFPPTQKVFAVGEVLAHLEYLEERQCVRRRYENGRVIFSNI